MQMWIRVHNQLFAIRKIRVKPYIVLHYYKTCKVIDPTHHKNKSIEYILYYIWLYDS